jgi:hypothetical protein
MDKSSEQKIIRGGPNPRWILMPGSVPSIIMVRLPRLYRHECSGSMYPLSADHLPVGPFVERICRSRTKKGRSGQINVQSNNYWSATTNANNTTNAWNVNFNNGNVNNNNKTNNNYAWCVQGGA